MTDQKYKSRNKVDDKKEAWMQADPFLNPDPVRGFYEKNQDKRTLTPGSKFEQDYFI